jgi:hypothetical protein
MKWMLIVLVFGAHAMETGLIYNSLDECMKAEADMRAQSNRISAGRAKEFQEMPVSKELADKQSIMGTCIPHAEP